MPSHRTTPDILRLRQGPGTNHPIIDRLLQGTELDKLSGPDANNWMEVNALLRGGHVRGWVMASFVQEIKEPDWLIIARQELGVAEKPGTDHNERILEYHSKTGLHAGSDEVAWCSSFVNWCMDKTGRAGTGSAAARSWANWGTKLDAPKPGCIVVFRRHDPNNPNAGHVAFFLRRRAPLVDVLGGNQSNSVRVSGYSMNDVLTYRWPNT
jgi:uncharacterized protein (TIGR02594 family)